MPAKCLDHMCMSGFSSVKNNIYCRGRKKELATCLVRIYCRMVCFEFCVSGHTVPLVLRGTGGTEQTHRIECVGGTVRIPWDCPTCPTWDRTDT